jgi:cyclopropane fatty-acyl-phospholipid synthase-like methyltransferase
MSNRTTESISKSLEVTQHLLPHMPFLLQDLWALGSAIEEIIDTVGSLNFVSNQSKALDLGCGKGAVSVTIASTYGIQVIGIDAMPEFLNVAQQKANEFNVSHLCKFTNQDIIDYISGEHDFDMVILASLGGILGSLKDTIAKLRTQVHSNGYILIDDGYLRKRNNIQRKGYEHYKDHEKTINELTFYNDLLLREINTTASSLKINKEYLHCIEKRAHELIVEYPEIENDIRNYIQLQAEECDVINDEIEGALWVLQKVD